MGQGANFRGFRNSGSILAIIFSRCIKIVSCFFNGRATPRPESANSRRAATSLLEIRPLDIFALLLYPFSSQNYFFLSHTQTKSTQAWRVNVRYRVEVCPTALRNKNDDVSFRKPRVFPAVSNHVAMPQTRKTRRIRKICSGQFQAS